MRTARPRAEKGGTSASDWTLTRRTPYENPRNRRCQGPLLFILLSGGNTHDCPPAQLLNCHTAPAKKLLGDKAFDSAELRDWLDERGTTAVIPNRSNRRQPFSFNKEAYKWRHRIENAFWRLKDFRHIATGYDKLARNYLAAVYLVAAIVWWIL